MLESLIATPQRMTFPASSPRIYGSCTLYAEAGTTVGATVGDLTFECPLFIDSERQLFSATLSLSPSSEHSQKPVVVKLVDRSYGAHVHHLLACHGFAPILYGYARREGAPTAYVMERLGSDWVMLFQFLKVEPPGTGFAAPISTSLQQLLELLDKEHVVHGDLRTNNIMLQIDDEGKPVISDRRANIKVIDYDWAGNAGEARYPPSRNEYIAADEEADGDASSLRSPPASATVADHLAMEHQTQRHIIFNTHACPTDLERDVCHNILAGNAKLLDLIKDTTVVYDARQLIDIELYG
ncbi:uncharacterized protein LAESUDRAFT_713594 [Laetiporus sulphureus 93-53]|uniref:Uncharacterized protein n=1 Tax=Laetiporus sulphureus 93-53 TaxID=1314785 RepID=A0A165EPK8_9APHY|nr:uncharacterized protein LAESUDRAFT_713594 [Laetiporus sulphureus 93-53]KZT07499.1 hypothetical protein LAESUDRAFT_713594 [Laetiporus sulphureus 93-53]